MYENVTTSEEDPSKLSLSYASTERYRIEAIQNITEKLLKIGLLLHLQTYIGMTY